MRSQARYAVTPLETLRHFGVLKALLLVALKVFRIRAVVVKVRTPKPTVRTENESLGIRRAAPDDGCLFEVVGFPQSMLDGKLAEGPGWIKVVDDQLVGWNFIGLQQSMIGDWLVLRSGSDTAVWSTGTWVRHEFRGSGLLNVFAGYGAEWAIDHGYREILSWIELTNYASRRATVKLGCSEIGRITVLLRLFGVALVHDGQRWHLGRWTASRPLVLSIEQIRQDRPRRAGDHEPKSPRPGALPGAK